MLPPTSRVTPGAGGEVRIDSLVKTHTVQVVQQGYTFGRRGASAMSPVT